MIKIAKTNKKSLILAILLFTSFLLPIVGLLTPKAEAHDIVVDIEGLGSLYVTWDWRAMIITMNDMQVSDSESNSLNWNYTIPVTAGGTDYLAQVRANVTYTHNMTVNISGIFAIMDLDSSLLSVLQSHTELFDNLSDMEFDPSSIMDEILTFSAAYLNSDETIIINTIIVNNLINQFQYIRNVSWYLASDHSGTSEPDLTGTDYEFLEGENLEANETKNLSWISFDSTQSLPIAINTSADSVIGEFIKWEDIGLFLYNDNDNNSIPTVNITQTNLDDEPIWGETYGGFNSILNNSELDYVYVANHSDFNLSTGVTESSAYVQGEFDLNGSWIQTNGNLLAHWLGKKNSTPASIDNYNLKLDMSIGGDTNLQIKHEYGYDSISDVPPGDWGLCNMQTITTTQQTITANITKNVFEAINTSAETIDTLDKLNIKYGQFGVPYLDLAIGDQQYTLGTNQHDLYGSKLSTLEMNWIFWGTGNLKTLFPLEADPIVIGASCPEFNKTLQITVDPILTVHFADNIPWYMTKGFYYMILWPFLIAGVLVVIGLGLSRKK